MNCCDEYGDCNQGRDCPARECKHCQGRGRDASGYPCTCTAVAKVGKKMHGPELLPPSVWRYQLRRLGYWLLMAVVGLLWLSFLLAVTAS